MDSTNEREPLTLIQTEHFKKAIKFGGFKSSKHEFIVQHQEINTNTVRI